MTLVGFGLREVGLEVLSSMADPERETQNQPCPKAVELHAAASCCPALVRRPVSNIDDANTAC